MPSQGSGGRPDRHRSTVAPKPSAATPFRDGTPNAQRPIVRAFQWDLARQVERLDVLQRLLPRYAAWGYHELYLHLEDAVHYPSLPGIARPEAYTHQQLARLVHTAQRAGIGVVPIVNLLGHTQYLIKHPEWRDLNELRDAHGAPLERGQVCPLHPRMLEVAEKLLRDMRPFCTTGKVHVGLDESFHLGKCPRCQAEVRRIGLAAHFAGHVQRLHALCARLGLELGMWADMLYFVPEAIPLLPRGITAYEWYYYPFPRLPRVELFNFAERDLATPLRKQGIRYYGCPMNGAFRYEPLPVFGDRCDNIKSWWRRCHEVQADGFLITSWEAYRLALETTTAVDAGAASLWLEPEQPHDNVSLLADGWRRLAGATPRAARAIARHLLQADAHAFAGYARWQINDRWDTFAHTEGASAFEKEARFLARLHQRAEAEDWPACLQASLAFRLYLAQRDVFVRQSARQVFRLRRSAGKPAALAVLHAHLLEQAAQFAHAIRDGRRAARAMWRASRSSRWQSQNEAVLRADETRLREWLRWLRRVARQPREVWSAAPVAGRWQLQFWVHNFAPCVQRIAVEQQDADGSWRELAGRHTIEFRAAAARPHSRIRREFSVPVPAPDTRLRLRLTGRGQVHISHLGLTNGVVDLRARAFRKKKTLGQPAAARGSEDLKFDDCGYVIPSWPASRRL